LWWGVYDVDALEIGADYFEARHNRVLHIVLGIQNNDIAPRRAAFSAGPLPASGYRSDDSETELTLARTRLTCHARVLAAREPNIPQELNISRHNLRRAARDQVTLALPVRA